MMLDSITFEGQQNIENLSPGIYTLELTLPVSGYSTSVQVEVNGLTPVEASILPSENLVYENEIILFEAVATGATAYEWNLGDGNTISGQTAIAHAYAEEGMYEVILTASNEACDATTSQTITVGKEDFSTSLTALESDSIRAYANGNRLFIVQNQTEQMLNVRIEVYNKQH